MQDRVVEKAWRSTDMGGHTDQRIQIKLRRAELRQIIDHVGREVANWLRPGRTHLVCNKNDRFGLATRTQGPQSIDVFRPVLLTNRHH